jgi:hypothetical protein
MRIGFSIWGVNDGYSIGLRSLFAKELPRLGLSMNAENFSHFHQDLVEIRGVQGANLFGTDC